MLKNVKTNHVWQIILPLFTYYIVFNCLSLLFRLLFQEKYGAMFALLLAAAITIIPIAAFYMSCPHLKACSYEHYTDVIWDGVFAVSAVLIAVCLNCFITYTGLAGNSESFKEAAATLSDGSLIIRLLANALVIPILEELLYRGVIMGQLYFITEPKTAIIISSLLFGILHFNIVQFLYAFLVGIALGMLHNRTKRLWTCVFAHGLTNLIVILFC